MASKRRDAIEGREQLGIEDEWTEDEEHYIGVDDANRHEQNMSWRNTKAKYEGNQIKEDKRATRSTVFLNITRSYVDAAAARLADMLLPNSEDDRCFAIQPTPMPDLDEMAESEVMQKFIDPQTGVVTEMSEAAWAHEMKELAAERADAEETQIAGWFAENQWAAKMRHVIEDTSKLGTGVIKGPVPSKKRTVKWSRNKDIGQMAKDIANRIVPDSKVVDPWNCYPDPACGENIQDGSYFWERDTMTVRQLKALKGQPGYIDEQIEACIKEGPIAPQVEWHPRDAMEQRVSKGSRWEIWYYTGMASREELETADYKFKEESETEQPEQYYHAIVTMVNHRVIKVALSPLDDGTFPYDVMIWQRRPGLWCGMGVSRQIRTPQRMLNAANRNMMDNAGLSGGGQVVIDTTQIYPLDGVWELSGRKLWGKKDGVGHEFDANKAFHVFSIETRQVELMNIVQFALRMAEESTGLPLIMQGQMGEMNKTDKVGIAQILNNNGSTVLRRLTKQFDDFITVPHVGRYHEWYMEYGEDDALKGDTEIVAVGSSTLVERNLQTQELLGLVQLSLVPAYGLDPAKTAEEYLRSRRYDPKRFKLDPAEQQQKLAENPPQPDPNVAKEQIKSEEADKSREHETIENDKDRELEMSKTLIETNSDNAKFNAEAVLKGQHGTGI